MSKITTAERKKVNDALYEISRHRHPHIPTGAISQALALAGVKTEEAIYCGRESRATMDLWKGDTEVSNSLLVLSWYKGTQTATYEINAYLS